MLETIKQLLNRYTQKECGSISIVTDRSPGFEDLAHGMFFADTVFFLDDDNRIGTETLDGDIMRIDDIFAKDVARCLTLIDCIVRYARAIGCEEVIFIDSIDPTLYEVFVSYGFKSNGEMENPELKSLTYEV